MSCPPVYLTPGNTPKDASYNDVAVYGITGKNATFCQLDANNAVFDNLEVEIGFAMPIVNDVLQTPPQEEGSIVIDCSNSKLYYSDGTAWYQIFSFDPARGKCISDEDFDTEICIDNNEIVFKTNNIEKYIIDAPGNLTETLLAKVINVVNDMNLTSVLGNVNISANSGSITTSSLTKEVTINNDINRTSTSGNINNTTDVGNITNTSSSGDINNTTTSGNINTTNTDGNINITSISGLITHTTDSGNITNTSTSGDINKTNTAGDIVTTNTTGAINTTNTFGPINTTTDSGNINTTTTSGNIDMTTNTGDICFSAPAGQIKEIAASKTITTTGEINVCAGTNLIAKAVTGFVDISSDTNYVTIDAGSTGDVSIIAGELGGSTDFSGGSNTSGVGGNVNVNGGDSSNTGDSGGSFNVVGGSSGPGNSMGGSGNIMGGNGTGTGSGGNIDIIGGTGGSSGPGGNVQVCGGVSSVGDPGGSLTLCGGEGRGGAPGGDVQIHGGDTVGGGTGGNVQVNAEKEGFINLRTDDEGGIRLRTFDENNCGVEMTTTGENNKGVVMRTQGTANGGIQITASGMDNGGITLTAPETKFVGDLSVTGTTTSLQTQTVNIDDNCIYLNNGYTTTVGKGGCIVINYEPTMDVALVDTGGFEAGIASMVNPNVHKTNSHIFSPGDIVQIFGANNVNNNGLFEVRLDSGVNMTVRGVGIESTTKDFFQEQFTTDPTVAGEIRKVNVRVIGSNANGDFITSVGCNTGDPTMLTTDIVVLSVEEGEFISVDDADTSHPIVNNEGVHTLVAGDDIEIDNTDPNNPIVNWIEPPKTYGTYHFNRNIHFDVDFKQMGSGDPILWDVPATLYNSQFLEVESDGRIRMTNAAVKSPIMVEISWFISGDFPLPASPPVLPGLPYDADPVIALMYIYKNGNPLPQSIRRFVSPNLYDVDTNAEATVYLCVLPGGPASYQPRVYDIDFERAYSEGQASGVLVTELQSGDIIDMRGGLVDVSGVGSVTNRELFNYSISIREI